MIQAAVPYPVTLSVDFPDKPRDRVSVGFRVFLAIPIAIILSALRGSILVFAAILMILFRQKYPKWWFDWNLELTRFNTRVFSYFFLLRDEYPSTDEEQAVHLNLAYPDAKKDLSQGMPLVKWFLAIPHYFVLMFLGFAAVTCAIISWFAILFTGKMPQSLFDFIVGVMRWGLRVAAYAFLLISDRYPPFSLEP